MLTAGQKLSMISLVYLYILFVDIMRISMLSFKETDITTVKGPVIILHGVNCQRVMGSGVAKALYLKWPEVRQQYMSIPKEEMHLGKTQNVIVDRDIWVVNGWTQENYGYDKKVYADSRAIDLCLKKTVTLADDLGITNIYLPKIGCGLGGLSWTADVLPKIIKLDQERPELSITICTLGD
jgi:O-acetyl-ADP-ribose deacetylase (regulator of RNase III)